MPSKLPGERRWRGRIYLPGGKERTRVFPTKREAKAWEAANRGKPAPSSEQLRQYVERVKIDVLLDGLSPSTKITYRGHLRLRILRDLGHLRLDQLTPDRIEQAVRAWSATGISPSAVTGTINCLSRILRHAVRAKALAANPVHEVTRPRPGPERTTPTLTLAEVDVLADTCQAVQQHYGDLVRIAASTGLRLGELSALQVQDVDLDLKLINVLRTYSADQPQSPKSRRTRQVPLDQHTHELLTRLCADKPPTAHVIVGPLGGRVRRQNLHADLDWSNLVARLGHPGLRFHDLRATAIVTWIRAGIPLGTVRTMAAHASLATTDRYARIARNDLADAAHLLDTYISRTSERS